MDNQGDEITLDPGRQGDRIGGLLQWGGQGGPLQSDMSAEARAGEPATHGGVSRPISCSTSLGCMKLSEVPPVRGHRPLPYPSLLGSDGKPEERSLREGQS